MNSLILAESHLLRLYSKLALLRQWCGERRGEGHRLIDVTWVAGEGDLSVHAIRDLLVLDLLLDVEPW